MNLDDVPRINSVVGKGSYNGLTAANVPTSDDEVRQALRNLGEPITYFGEDKAERRERLIKLVLEQPHTNFDFAYVDEEEYDDKDMEDEEDDELYYTPGSPQLEEARRKILGSSLERASERVKEQARRHRTQDFIKTLKHRRYINKKLSLYDLSGTQLLSGNTRAISSVKFSPDGSLIACGSWDGNVYFLDKETLTQVASLKPDCHSEKVSTIDWCPKSEKLLLSSGGAEGNINLWSVDGSIANGSALSSDRVSYEKGLPMVEPAYTLFDAHPTSRITSTLFHPSGNYMASTSFDKTWKLWDINRPEEELIQQEGHSKELYCASFHADGSILSTAGLDSVCILWDLRSGRSIANLEGHIKGIYDMSWSPNGYHLATGSGDSSIKVWDIRKYGRKTPLVTIPSHRKLVSSVNFFQKYGNHDKSNYLETEVTDGDDQGPEILDSNGTFLVSASYDSTLNVWSADNWINVKTLKGHSDKVMSCDIYGDASQIISSGWDRSVKLWSI